VGIFQVELPKVGIGLNETFNTFNFVDSVVGFTTLELNFE